MMQSLLVRCYRSSCTYSGQQGVKVLLIEAGPQIKRNQASNYEPRDTIRRISEYFQKNTLIGVNIQVIGKIIQSYMQMN